MLSRLHVAYICLSPILYLAAISLTKAAYHEIVRLIQLFVGATDWVTRHNANKEE